jgi:hypothetical protein
MADDFDEPLPDDVPPDDAPHDDALAEEAEAAEDAAPEEPAAEETPPAEPPPEEPPDEIVAPSPSLLTIVLFVLNIAAALAFGYLVLLDYSTRQRWSYAIFRDDLVLWGLPLQEEETTLSGSQATRPPAHVDPERIKKEAADRGVRVSDKFQAVHEVVGQRIKPSQLTDEVLKELFKGVGQPVRTLEEEVDRVQKTFLADVEKAAAELSEAAKTEQAKRARLRDLLLPLAPSPWQIDVVDKKIGAARAADLDRLLADAGQRYVLVNTLRLLEERLPTVPRNDSEENVKDVARRKALLDGSADPTVVKLEDLRALMTERFEHARGGGALSEPKKQLADMDKESYSRRANIAYLLLAVSKARKPANTAEPLYPQGSERVAVVVGLYEYGSAANELIQALLLAEQRTLQTLAEDRDGYPVRAGGKLETTPAFVGRHRELIQRIVDVVGEIKDQESRLSRLEELEAKHKKQYEGRKEHYDDVVAKLLAARRETSLQAVELRRLEQQLFRAQLDLADAARTNEVLEQQIRAAERSARGRRKRP